MRKRDHLFFDALHNKYQGERLWIVGTGPSLRENPGERINLLAERGEHVWAINLFYECTFVHFVAEGHLASEIDWLPQVAAHVAGMPTMRLFTNQYDPECHEAAKGGVDPFPDWNWVYRSEKRDMRQGWFNGFDDELWVVAEGWGTLPSTGLQLAAAFGFSTVCLLGCETTHHGHAYPDYIEPPTRDIERQGMVQASVAVARKEFEKRGKRIVDLSGPTGTLPLEKSTFDQALGLTQRAYVHLGSTP